MFEQLAQLVVLFFVIFDPLASFVVFLAATKGMKKTDKTRAALLAVLVAASVSAVVLLLGTNLLALFNTDLNNFRVAGGIVLSLLGIKMAMGQSLANVESVKGSAEAIASVIGTPLLTGPAAISAIIISSSDYGMATTAAAVGIVLGLTLLLLAAADHAYKAIGKTGVQVMSTLLGLITLAWGVGFVLTGLGW